MNIKHKIHLPILTCLRCGHEWIPRKVFYAVGTNFPISCPKCRSWYWDIPLGTLDLDKVKTQINKAHGKEA